ncbi:hypothetical protein Csa_009597 [Cucumis sativus]|nr:hypothetical protein Csa_009597 [Cucumis sativus]
MKRSSSASIVSDNRFVCSSSSLSLSSIFRSSSVSSGLESEPYLPTFSPFSHAAEKKRRHLKLAKIFIHSIPFVILFCAIVLWLFSDPECLKSLGIQSVDLVVVMYALLILILFQLQASELQSDLELESIENDVAL